MDHPKLSSAAQSLRNAMLEIEQARSGASAAPPKKETYGDAGRTASGQDGKALPPPSVKVGRMPALSAGASALKRSLESTRVKEEQAERPQAVTPVPSSGGFQTPRVSCSTSAQRLGLQIDSLAKDGDAEWVRFQEEKEPIMEASVAQLGDMPGHDDATDWVIPKPVRPKNMVWTSEQHREAYEVVYQCDWFMHSAPKPLLIQMLGGPESARQVPSMRERRELLLALFKFRKNAGKCGQALAKHRRALAIIKKMAKARGLSNGGFPVGKALAADIVRGEHLRAIAKGKGCRGGSTVGHSLRATLKKLERLGAKIEANDNPLIEAAAPPPARGGENKAGSLPIKVRCHIEYLAGQCKHQQTREFCQGLLALGLSACLRTVELLRARLDTDLSDDDNIVGHTVMKDGEAMTIFAPAEGFLGKYEFMPALIKRSKGKDYVLAAPTCNKGDTGNVTLAKASKAGVMGEADFRKSLTAVLGLPPLKMTPSEVADLDIRGHSPHGTMSDMMVFVGAPTFLEADSDIAAHWRRRSIEHEMLQMGLKAKGKATAVPGKSQEMRILYSTGKGKLGVERQQMKVRKKFNRFVQQRLENFGKSWTELPPGRADWNILLDEASESEQMVDSDEESDSD